MPLGKVLVSFYWLSIITISLCGAVWPQFAVPVFEEGLVPDPRFGVRGGRRSAAVPLDRALVSSQFLFSMIPYIRKLGSHIGKKQTGILHCI